MRGLGLLGGEAQDGNREKYEACGGRNPLVAGTVLGFMWEIRDYLPESIVLYDALPIMLDKLHGRVYEAFKQVRYSRGLAVAKANVDAVRNTFLEMLLPIVDRVLCKKGEVGLYDTYYKKDDAKAATYREMEEVIARCHGRYEAMVGLNPRDKQSLTIANPPDPSYSKTTPPVVNLDSNLYKLVVARENFHHTTSTLGSLNVYEKMELKDRLWKLGTIVCTMHNNLHKPRLLLGGSKDHENSYRIFADVLLRKTFAFIRYTMQDSFVDTILMGHVSGPLPTQPGAEEESDSANGGGAEEETKGNA